MSQPQKLPPVALARIGALRAAAQDAEALIASSRAAVDAAEHHAHHLGRLVAAARDPSEAAELQAQADAVGAELERLRRERDIRLERRAAAGGLLANVESWLARQARDRVQLEAAPPVGMPPGAELGAVRAEVAQLAADIPRLAGAALPKDELRRLVAEHVAQLAAAGRPLVSTRPHLGGPVVSYRVGHSNIAGLTPLEAAQMLAWFDADRLAERLMAEVDALPDEPGALAPDERSQRLAAARARLLELERTEVALVEAAPGAFMRRDTDPLAVLGLQVAGEAPAQSAAA